MEYENRNLIELYFMFILNSFFTLITLYFILGESIHSLINISVYSNALIFYLLKLDKKAKIIKGDR